MVFWTKYLVPTAESSESSSGALSDPRIADLLQYWKGHCLPGGLPDRDAFDAIKLRRWIGAFSIYEYDRDRDDFLNRLEGSGISRLTGQNWTGRYASEVDRLFRGGFLPRLRQVCRNRRPFADFATVYQRRYLSAWRLLLPVAKSGGTRPEQVFLALFEWDQHATG